MVLVVIERMGKEEGEEKERRAGRRGLVRTF